ncbi:hypothetical protein SLEP1_g24414 [Rubroshorea leprosula]|uniref:DUF4216 domain-containing protein n=1 Tax=Rubroshorea leprosula TaxID=152421 RepID=A0AAV5JR59_9ROSI|nr:hypothetical protein SLEP1_g24414 [Rubroshorea leprosula]
MDAYSVWWAHGETLSNNVDPWFAASDVASSSNIEEHDNAKDDFHHMVYDAFCPSENDRHRNETKFASENVGDARNNNAQSFYDLLRASTIPLGSASNNQTLLGWLSYMLHTKAKNNISGVGYNEIIHGYRFNPWGHSSRSYSCWPVFIVVYNLPPEMCMRLEFTFLTLVISGPKSPGKNIDVFSRPLIDDLKRLWSSGIETFDSFHKQNFTMRAMVMWTIMDFPGYGMFLPASHSYKMDTTHFLEGRFEFGPPPPRLDGHSVRLRVATLPDVLFGNPSVNQTIFGFGETHNWVKRSIFWELPYWEDNLIRHNLDVMHSEKNFFDNIIHTIMDDSSSKDNVKSRMDLPLYCDREELHLYYDCSGSLCKPNASYALNTDKKRCLCTWLKHVRFPDGFASNIACCVNLAELRLVRLKSHDCNIFMQRLIPIAFRGLLLDSIWGPLTETRCLTTQEMKAAELYVLLNCREVDALLRGTRINQVYDIVEVNPQYRLSTGKPFCLACQSTQVYYTSYPSDNRATKGWFAACKIRARHLIDTCSTSLDIEEIFQDEEPPSTQSLEHNSNLASTECVDLHTEGATMVDLNGNANDDVDENASEGNDGYETRSDAGGDSSKTE